MICKYEMLVLKKEAEYRDREVLAHGMSLDEYKRTKWPVGTIWIGSLNGRVYGPPTIN